MSFKVFMQQSFLLIIFVLSLLLSEVSIAQGGTLNSTSCYSIDGDNFAEPDYAQIPRFEVRAIPFAIRLKLNNDVPICELEMQIEVKNDLNEIVHLQSKQLESDSQIIDLVFEEAYTPPCTHIDVYTFTYKLIDKSINEVEDSRSFSLKVGDVHIQIQSGLGQPLSNSESLDSIHAYAFIVYNDFDVSNAVLQFGVFNNPLAVSYGVAHLQIYELLGEFDEVITPQQRKLVGANDVIIDLMLPDLDTIEVSLYKVDDEGNILDYAPKFKEKTNYLVVIFGGSLGGKEVDFLIEQEADLHCEMNYLAHDSLNLNNHYGYYQATLKNGGFNITNEEIGIANFVKSCQPQLQTTFTFFSPFDIWFNCAATSTKEVVSNNISVFPNPITNRETLFVETNDIGADNKKVSLFNIQGQLIHCQNIIGPSRNRLELTFPTIQSGVYFIRIKTSNKEFVEKIIVLE